MPGRVQGTHLSRKGFCRHPRVFFQTNSEVNFAGRLFVNFLGAFFLEKKQEEKSPSDFSTKARLLI